jgi:hypothetical protein
MKTSITAPTKDQQNHASRFVGDVARKAAETAIDQMITDSGLSAEALQRFLGKGKRLNAKIIPFIKGAILECSAVIKGCLKRISGEERLTLDPTDGTETLAKADDVFSSIDSDYRTWGTDVTGKPTQEVGVEVYEMAEDADFPKMFGGFDAELDDLCFTQPQIKQFAKKHRKWLRADGYGTFFLFKVGGEFFVAHVRVHGAGRLSTHVYRLSHDNVWNAVSRHRVVVPQLALENQN